MATTSARALALLSLLEARPDRPGSELAERLGVSTRTLRRDVATLRELGYPVAAGPGPDGGYRLGARGRLPPLVLDDEQAVAIAVALQTAPATVAGIDVALDRALSTVTRGLPETLRAAVESLHLTALRNAWDFAGPPIAPGTLRAAGDAVRRGHVLRFDLLDAGGRRPDPADPGFTPPLRVEPHHLVVWAGRWYLVAYDPAATAWAVHRVDRMHPLGPTGTPFRRREVPGGSVARFVMTRPDRGDTPARWQCTGSAVLGLPADVVARWAPGGSVVEAAGPGRARLTVGAWSWAGIAGLLATFDADVSEVEPAQLRRACAEVARRLRGATGR